MRRKGTCFWRNTQTLTVIGFRFNIIYASSSPQITHSLIFLRAKRRYETTKPTSRTASFVLRGDTHDGVVCARTALFQRRKHHRYGTHHHWHRLIRVDEKGGKQILNRGFSPATFPFYSRRSPSFSLLYFPFSSAVFHLSICCISIIPPLYPHFHIIIYREWSRYT